MIILPMMGKSSRFFNDGYTIPKYKLPINSKSVFQCVLESFNNYFGIETFVIICPDDIEIEQFVIENISRFTDNYTIIKLNNSTDGQAHTVYALKDFKDKLDLKSDIYIFNIDTFKFNTKLIKYEKTKHLMFETFIASGDNWSFAECDSSDNVLKVYEKERVSKYCSNGLYHFPSLNVFFDTFDAFYKNSSVNYIKGECFIAPMYNYLISQGYIIKNYNIDNDDIICCGTPEEYESLCENDIFIKKLGER